jgi:hypothetical protein
MLQAAGLKRNHLPALLAVPGVDCRLSAGAPHEKNRDWHDQFATPEGDVDAPVSGLVMRNFTNEQRRIVNHATRSRLIPEQRRIAGDSLALIKGKTA